ncbi:rhodanese-like domain-containing protein [Gordonia sp. X0973]|uniref:rhodanese-like domain-containing protein n=1 Tax=Gordonia sp. X0973 TaxID=2742602 RepID=UPI000F5457D1|nr:rhodanese-like domain-containing protein [Gordonia sp. X0973]QKT05829.1 rhodanese-like domain-containing protein [Gordonia sp. X0973]
MAAYEQVPVGQLPDDFTGETDRVLLDIREPDEWAGGHVRGALHIPLGEVPERIDEIDPDVELFVVCRTSGRSFRMAEYFEHVGREALVVEGGMVAWEASGKPVVVGE